MKTKPEESRREGKNTGFELAKTAQLQIGFSSRLVFPNYRAHLKFPGRENYHANALAFSCSAVVAQKRVILLTYLTAPVAVYYAGFWVLINA